MAAPSPSLSISELMHPLSPQQTATTPSKPASPTPRQKSPTPEPLAPAEIEEMRKKVFAMGWGDSSKGKEKVASREDELAAMLLRLTHPASLPQPSQLHAQAETIANLIQQRDFILQRSIEEQGRWDSEREGWARAAQALIIQNRREAAHWDSHDNIVAQYAQMTPDMAIQRLHDFERANAGLQTDKKALQQKLSDAQNRLASLESELAQLKPLLLMQPFALMHSHPISGSHGWSASLPNLGTPGRRRQGEEQPVGDIDSDEDHTVPHTVPQTRQQFGGSGSRQIGRETPTPASPQKAGRGDYYRRRDTPGAFSPTKGSTSKVASRKGAPSATVATATFRGPLLSDARTEHLLLAARKIGMQRATALTGAFPHLQQLTATSVKPEPPSSPQKTTGRRGGPSSPTKTPKTPRRPQIPTTPLLTRTPLNFTSSAAANAAQGALVQRTPLQSLLSAAQSVLSAPSTSKTAGPDAGSPGSPLAKKRKLDHNPTILKSAPEVSPSRKGKEKAANKRSGVEDDGDGNASNAPSRVKSALDFLADQAAAFSSQPPSQASMDDRDGESQERSTSQQAQDKPESEDGDGEEDAEGEDESVDVEMVDATLFLREKELLERVVEAPTPTRRSNRLRARGKLADVIPVTLVDTRKPGMSADSGNEEESMETQTQMQSQDMISSEKRGQNETPNTSQGGSFTLQSTSQPREETNRPPESTPPRPTSEPGRLAPPINLSPRASRSPTSSSNLVQGPTSNRSRSRSAERPVPAAPGSHPSDTSTNATPSGSFNMFSLQRPQPLAATGPSSVLQHGNGDPSNLVEDQGPSVLLTSRIDGVKFIAEDPPHRTRSPYVKWTKEEDELLAKAVGKYGQKWDLVQKALPSRGYHQVRQRWLRKLSGLDTSKMDLSTVEPNDGVELLQTSTAPPTDIEKSPEASSSATGNPNVGLTPPPPSIDKVQASSPSGNVSESPRELGNDNENTAPADTPSAVLE